MRKPLLWTATLIAVMSGQAFAQSGLERASTNPAARQLVIELSNGAMVVADDTSQKFLVVAESGEKFEVSFSDAVASIESDPVKRRQLLSEFRDALNDPKHQVTISKPRLAVDDSTWPLPSMCGDVACIDPYAGGSETGGHGLLTKSNTTCSNHYLCPRNLAPCDLGPCSPARWGDNFMFYSGLRAGWGEDRGGGNLSMQELVAYDQRRWEQARQEACEDTHISAATSVAAAAVMGGSCLLAGTGAGALVCAGSIVVYGISLHQTFESRERCLADYPGLGNW